MPDLISQPITPHKGSFDTGAMARGEPGLPRGFTWRSQSYDVIATLEQWKQTSREGGTATGETYLRRHYYKLRMSDGSIWTVYVTRQPPKTGSAKQRWFLYTIA